MPTWIPVAATDPLTISIAVNILLLIVIAALFAKYSHMFEHGHAPAGKTLVPAVAVSVADVPVLTDAVVQEEEEDTPAQALATMSKDGKLPANWHMVPDAKPHPSTAALLAARSYRVALAVFGEIGRAHV